VAETAARSARHFRKWMNLWTAWSVRRETLNWSSRPVDDLLSVVESSASAIEDAARSTTVKKQVKFGVEFL